MSWLRYLIILVILTIPYTLRDFTPGNELKYISIATEALHTGRFFAFTDHGMTYADKPPLYLWGLMLIIKLFGYNYPILFGLLSTIPACVILWIMDKWTNRFLPANYVVIPSLLLVTTGMFLGGALVLRMDMLMSMFIVLAMYVFYNVYTEKYRGYKKYLLSLFIFLAVFTKGPFGFLIPVFSIIIFLISKKELYKLKGYITQLLVVLLLVLFWFTLIYIEGGKLYIKDILFNQVVARGVDSFDHGRPFYYYFITIWYCLLPWIISCVIVLFFAVKRNLFKNDVQRLFITVIGTSLFLISLVSCKLDIYMLPFIPFLIYLVVLFLPFMNNNKWVKYSFRLIYILFLFVLPFYLLLGKYFLPVNLVFNYLIIVGLIIMSIHSVFSIYKLRTSLSLSIKYICVGIGTLFLCWTFSFKELNPYIGYKELDKKICLLFLDTQIKNYYSYRMWDISYMDMYSGNEVVNLESVDNIDNISENDYLFIVSDKRLKQEPELINIFSDKESFKVGNYNIFVVN